MTAIEREHWHARLLARHRRGDTTAQIAEAERSLRRDVVRALKAMCVVPRVDTLLIAEERAIARAEARTCPPILCGQPARRKRA